MCRNATTGKTHFSTFDYEIWIKLFLSTMMMPKNIHMYRNFISVCIVSFGVKLANFFLPNIWNHKNISSRQTSSFLPVFFLSFPRSAAHKTYIQQKKNMVPKKIYNIKNALFFNLFCASVRDSTTIQPNTYILGHVKCFIFDLKHRLNTQSVFFALKQIYCLLLWMAKK